MKKLLIGFALFASMSSFATENVCKETIEMLTEYSIKVGHIEEQLSRESKTTNTSLTDLESDYNDTLDVVATLKKAVKLTCAIK